MSEETKDMPKVSSDMEAPKALNYIEKLVAELCPGGVEYVNLEQCVEKNYGGGTPSKSKEEYWDGGIPWASVGDLSVPGISLDTTRAKITPLGLENSSTNIVPAGSVVVAIKISPGNMKVTGIDTAINQDLRGLTLLDNISARYLTYYFKTLKFTGRGTIVKSITNSSLMRTKIPLPPVEVQNAIVEILDKFTKLEAELEAELAARRAQYEYYRNSLFENLSGGGSEILGNLGKFIRGNGLQKKDLCVSGNPAIHYGQIYTQYGIWTHDTMSYIDESNYKKLRKAQPGSIIIATTSENDEDLGKAVAWLGNKEVAVSGDSYIYKHSMNPKYVSYFFSTYIFHDQKKKYITGTKVRRISGGNLAKIKIPIPSLAEQERIVKILDKFDALVNDISSGLPAEIEARRKQYEYYRDRLLTFPRASDFTEHKH
ncbi:restriction endonuclease subunit S [Rothia dentocariosa]|uniref:restriction endonuclease subunit S n=1 Tax=Rothia dentocariosa TaxID=2047 RepID=UPI003C7CDA52